MKSKFLFFCLLLSGTLCSQKTTYIHPSVLSANFFLNDFKGSSPFIGSGKMNGGISMGYLKGISSNYDWTINIYGSFLDSVSKSSESGNKPLLLQMDAMVRGRLFGSQHRVQPYFNAGIGASSFKNYYGFYLPFGGGMEINYKDVFVSLNAHYRQSVSRNINSHIFYSIGIGGVIAKKKVKRSSTKASVPNAYPVVTIKTSVKDRDGDGINDTEDKCPDVPGSAIHLGCPIPDTDRDGMNNEQDKCPDVAGFARYGGCPIPDSDKDGVNDELDKCIQLAGVKENEGCPIIKLEIVRKVETAAKNIFFETASYKLLPKSFAALDEIASILKSNPGTNLIIEGHTDNEGTKVANQVLSSNRSNEVLNYLESKGIERSRLQAIGYGQTKPIADNKHKEGRSLNRRVEFKLEYN